jgi:hypothetical protein
MIPHDAARARLQHRRKSRNKRSVPAALFLIAMLVVWSFSALPASGPFTAIGALHDQPIRVANVLGGIAQAAAQPAPGGAVVIDHLILGVKDLDRGVAEFAAKTGVRPVFGGVHPGRGTWNALASLGDGRYIEILAPNPQAPTASPRIDDLKAMDTLTPVGWALATTDLAAVDGRMRARGLRIAAVRAGSRALPDGSMLEWSTAGVIEPAHNWLPFFIQWANPGLQPAATSPGGCRLQAVALEDPNPDPLRAFFDAVGFDLPLTRAEQSRMTIVLQCPKGTVTFR